MGARTLYQSMAQYQVVDHFHVGLGGAEICLIERTLPGELPVCFQFKGDWAKAQIEADRLNAVGKTKANLPRLTS
jgi:hypothetical protein